jgi:hypothetical protein
MHELTRLAFGLCCFQFFFRQAERSANAEILTNSFNRRADVASGMPF